MAGLATLLITGITYVKLVRGTINGLMSLVRAPRMTNSMVPYP